MFKTRRRRRWRRQRRRRKKRRKVRQYRQETVLQWVFGGVPCLPPEPLSRRTILCDIFFLLIILPLSLAISVHTSFEGRSTHETFALPLLFILPLPLVSKQTIQIQNTHMSSSPSLLEKRVEQMRTRGCGTTPSHVAILTKAWTKSKLPSFFFLSPESLVSLKQRRYGIQEHAWLVPSPVFFFLSPESKAWMIFWFNGILQF